jgi:hypothetical protein
MEKSSIAQNKVAAALRVAPGLQNLLGYRREWLRHDAVAGVSVAAVALPTAIAYAELIGFEPVVGQSSNRGPRLAGALRRAGNARRRRPFPDPQISRGCLRLGGFAETPEAGTEPS